MRHSGLWSLLTIMLLLAAAGSGMAAPLPTISFGVEETAEPTQVATALEVLFVLTVLTIAPAILLMTTSFVRIVVVLSFVRQAMGTQQMPPNQIIIGLAMFLSFFVMAPTYQQVYDNSLQPYMAEELGPQQALEQGVAPIRDFMFNQVREKDLQLMLDIAKRPQPEGPQQVKTTTLIPAFMLSELRKAFTMGFMVYVPFLVVDMVVASVLMSMGMLMLPPVIISLPFKLLLFVLVDGWTLVVSSLVKSFY